MNINDKRIQKKIDSIIYENLSNGHLPTSNEVIGSISKYIYENNLSMPNYEFSKIYKDFDIEDLNNSRMSVAEDLSIVYKSILELYEEIDGQVEKFDAEKKKFDYKINSLQSTLFNLANQYSASGYAETFIENVVDMQNFNISLSDCDIDLQNQNITLKRLQDKPYTNIASISVESDSEVIQNGRLIDYINTDGHYWQGIVSKDKQEKTYVSIIIDFGKTVNINQVEINAPLLKTGLIDISTSNTMESWIAQYAGVLTTKCLANMQGEFRYIKLVISKEEADKFILNTYQYHFIIDTIRFFQVNYASKSVLISNPIKTNSNINKVSIVDESIRPNSTNVKYYVALNSSTPEWVPINPLNDIAEENKVITFNTIETGRFRDIYLPEGISSDAYKQFKANGQNIYSIGEIKDIEITKNALYKGINSWRVDVLKDIETIEGPVGKAIFIKNQMSDNLSTYYKPILAGYLFKNDSFNGTCAVKFTTTIECPKEISPKSAKISSTYPLSIYLNGDLIYSGTPDASTEVTYAFKEKKNVLEVVININKANAGDENPISIVTTHMNLDLAKISTQIYADPDPMTEVSLFNLKYNMNNKKNVYALRKINDGYQILIKDDDLSIGYRFFYDYIAQNANELLVKVELSREFNSINVTPRLEKYEVRII